MNGLPPPPTLINRVARGEFSFLRLVEILSNEGYLTEHSAHPNCSFGSGAMKVATQSEFDALHKFLLPGAWNDISVSTTATDKGGIKDVYSYALFNTKIISQEDMTDILIRENRKIAQSGVIQ